MYKRAGLVLAVVSLTLLAGCSGFSAVGFENETDRTAYGVEQPLDPETIETEADESSQPLLPGLSTDPDEIARGTLREKHVDTFSDSTYTVQYRSTTVLENGTVAIDNTAHIQWDNRNGTGLLRESFDGTLVHADGGHSELRDRSTIETYYNTTDWYSRHTLENGTVSFSQETYYFAGSRSTAGDILSEAHEYELTVYEDDGDRYYHLHSSTPVEYSAFADDGFTVDLYLTDDGRIAYASLEGEIALDRTRMPYDGGTATVRESVRFSAHNETTLEEPAWLETAREETNSTANDHEQQPATDPEENADDSDANGDRADAYRDGLDADQSDRDRTETTVAGDG